jgi:hypothetical protein
MEEDGFSSLINNISLAEFIGGAEPDNAIMSYIGYGLYDVKAVSGENYSYTGKCDINGTPVDVYITVGSDGKINRVYRVDGTNEIDVGGTTIDGVDSLLNNVTKKLALPDLMDVKSTDGNIMTFLAFGITKDGDSYYYHLDGKTYLCDITVDSDNVILSATYTDSEGTKVVEKTKVDEVSTKINQMMDELTVKDIVDNWEASSKLLEKVGNSTINSISSIMDDIYLTDVMDVDAPTEDNTNAIMLYLSYGLTKVTATNNEGLFTATYSQYEEVTENNKEGIYSCHRRGLCPRKRQQNFRSLLLEVR